MDAARSGGSAAHFFDLSRVGGVRRGQRGDERLLRHLDPADHLHPLLAFLLLLQQLALAGDVTAVALGEHVLADGADRLAGDDPAADGGLDRHLELLARDQLAQLRRDRDAVVVRLVLVHDRGERVDRLAVQQDVDLDQLGRLLAAGLVVEAGVALGAALQLVEEVVDDLAERQRVAQLDPVGGQVVHARAGRRGGPGTAPSPRRRSRWGSAPSPAPSARRPRRSCRPGTRWGW